MPTAADDGGGLSRLSSLGTLLYYHKPQPSLYLIQVVQICREFRPQLSLGLATAFCVSRFLFHYGESVSAFKEVVSLVGISHSLWVKVCCECLFFSLRGIVLGTFGGKGKEGRKAGRKGKERAEDQIPAQILKIDRKWIGKVRSILGKSNDCHPLCFLVGATMRRGSSTPYSSILGPNRLGA